MTLRDQALEQLSKANRLRPIVYISGPITKGCRNHNLYQAMVAHENLLAAGFSVINPMPSMMFPFNCKFEHLTWLENDLPHVRVAAAVLRLPGESLGAEMECIYAKECGVPVYEVETWQLPYLHRIIGVMQHELILIKV